MRDACVQQNGNGREREKKDNKQKNNTRMNRWQSQMSQNKNINERKNTSAFPDFKQNNVSIC